MRYPLHTTTGLENLPALLQQEGRMAVWLHVASEDDHEWAVLQITNAGWKLLAGLPCFFVVGVHPSVSEEDAHKLREYLKPQQDKERIEFLGRMFGYAQWEIGWYEWALGILPEYSISY